MTPPQTAAASSTHTTHDHDTVIIGGGQAGLALSRLLTDRARDHVILEREHQLASSWRNRWDSFRLVTPAWWLRLPGHHYGGNDPDGFLARDEVVDHLLDYASSFDPPVRFGVTATRVAHDGDWYRVETTDGTHRARNVVVATGTFQSPSLPAASRTVPGHVDQVHSSDYRNPKALPDGGVLVVGSGQSGSQIARELHEAGRDVHLSVGSATRLPRRYRGRDGMWWAVQLGITDQTVDELDSPAERFEPNPQISGQDGGRDVNLHEYSRDGITLVGRLTDIRDGRVHLAGDLHDRLTAADRDAAGFRDAVDDLVDRAGIDAPVEAVSEPRDGFEQQVITELDLADAGISTILWATGFNFDYGWIDLPILDQWGYPVQQRGVTEFPGLYFLGLHWMHTLKSSLFLGVGDDAAHVADHIAGRGTGGHPGTARRPTPATA